MPLSRNRFLIIAASSIGLGICLFSPGSAMAASTSSADITAIKAAAEQGHVRDEIALADAYMTGRGVQQDMKLAAFWYEKAAGSGDPLAQNQIGYFYEVGLGVPTDAARAVHWFQLAAAGGFVDAKVNLGVAYMWGTGVQQNKELAEKLIREAANKGSAIGATYLGDMCFFGVGIPQDKAAAEHWYEKGAKRHYSLAVYRLASMLAEPGAKPRNLPRAASLFREAALAGFVPAKHSLALLLVNHPELNESDHEAISLLDESAEAGTWKSSVVLGILSRDGKIVPQDDSTAYFHFQVALRQGGDLARALVSKDLQTLEGKLDAQQRAQIDERVNGWMQKHNVTLEVIYRNGDRQSQFPAFGLAATPPSVHAAALVPTNPFR